MEDFFFFVPDTFYSIMTLHSDLLIVMLPRWSITAVLTFTVVLEMDR